MINFKNWSKRKKIIIGIIVLIIIGIGSNQTDPNSTSSEKTESKTLNINGVYNHEGDYNSSAQFVVNGNNISGYYGYGITDRTYLQNDEKISHYINDMNQIIFHDKLFNRKIVKGEITKYGTLKYQTENGLITAKK